MKKTTTSWKEVKPECADWKKQLAFCIDSKEVGYLVLYNDDFGEEVWHAYIDGRIHYMSVCLVESAAKIGLIDKLMELKHDDMKNITYNALYDAYVLERSIVKLVNYISMNSDTCPLKSPKKEGCTYNKRKCRECIGRNIDLLFEAAHS